MRPCIKVVERRWRQVVAALLLGGGLANGAAADDLHYRNQLVGERSAGMGGAYTGVAEGPSGLYYNPAGVVYSSASNITASVTAYTQTDKTYNRGLSGLSDWERQSTTFVPNYFGLVQPLGKGVVGLSYAVPDAALENQDLEYADLNQSIERYVVNFNNQDSTYYIGPSYAMEVSPQFSLGVTAYLHYRERERITNQLADYTGSGYDWTTIYFETSEYGVKPILGLMWTPRDKLAFGLSVSDTYLYSADAMSQTMRQQVNGQFTYTRSSTDHKRELPYNVSLGAAYFPSSRTLLAADIAHYGATEDEIFGNAESVTNFALGAEYYWSPSLALRGGAFSDYANTIEPISGGTGQREHIDVYGLSASVTHFTRNASLTLGVVLKSGSGTAQVVGGSTEIQDVDYFSASIFLASSYSY